MTTAFLYDHRFLNHDTGKGHPERKERLEATISHLQQNPWFEQLLQLKPRSIEPEWVATTHQTNYVARADQACQSGAPYVDSPDVAVSTESCDVARLAAGGVLELTDAVMKGYADNGFALIRPPGHHAENSTALGFCIFNNVAICARYLQQNYGLDKIAILDWDVHHGNGTQHTFEEDPSVLYVSTHQYPFYPGTGAVSESGIGRGQGATLNCPMSAGSTDADYQAAFSEKILPKLEDFKPEAILLSAGFDAHSDDPLGQINLSTSMYTWMSQRMMEVADKHCNGRLISMLEGGYDLNALAVSVATHLEVMSDSVIN